MIRVDVHQRLIRTARRLGPETVARSEELLRLISQHFGDPHKHSGISLRKLGRLSYEARIGLQWRIVLIKEKDRLTAYDMMDHDEVRAWLKGRKGD